MKITTTILAAYLCVTLVNSLPLEGFQSQALDRLMASESEDDSALRNKRTIGLLRQFFPEVSKRFQDVNAEASETNQVANEADTQDSAAAAAAAAAEESQNNEVRVQFDDETPKGNEANEGELAPLDDESNDDDNRNKRFLNFGFGSSGGNGNGGSGGGSGNFLFDIIRQAADGAARAAGTVYRVVAGTQSLGLGLSASRDVGPAPTPMMMPAAANAMMPQAGAMQQGMMKPTGNGTAMMPGLVAGSGSSSSDPAAGAPEPGPQTEAVPGPVTRLFVIANRGISNLVQDLILRLAATSERIVNFKARLITSII